MKILLITEFFPTNKSLKFSGGVEARTYFVGKYLAEKHDVFVVCSRQPGSRKKELIDGINVLRVGPEIAYNAGSGKMNPIKLISFVVNAVIEGKKIRADIVDGGNFLAHLIAKIISLNLKVPVVFWYPDVFLGKWIKTSGIITGIFGSILEKLNIFLGADKYIAISNETKKKLIKFGVTEKNILTIPCGVEKSEFIKKTSKSTDLYILCVSRLVPYKRVKDLIWAFSYLIKKGHFAKLVIVGEGPEKKKLQQLVSMLKLKHLVDFKSGLGRKELINLYNKSKIFCLPSEVEGFGISVIEANTAGIPYVISDIPVFKEITRNGKGGVLFKLGSTKDLANKLVWMWDEKNYLNKVKEGRSLYKMYDWKKIATDTENLYSALIK